MTWTIIRRYEIRSGRFTPISKRRVPCPGQKEGPIGGWDMTSPWNPFLLGRWVTYMRLVDF